jgi:hypothetical protein
MEPDMPSTRMILHDERCAEELAERGECVHDAPEPQLAPLEVLGWTAVAFGLLLGVASVILGTLGAPGDVMAVQNVVGRVLCWFGFVAIIAGVIRR